MTNLSFFDLLSEELITVVVSIVLSFFASRYWFMRRTVAIAAKDLAGERARMLVRIEELEKQMAVTAQAVVPISTAFQAILIKELTHFHTPVMDALLEKLGPPYCLTSVEEQELTEALIMRAKEIDYLISEEERDAATMLPFIIKRARAESKLLGHANLRLIFVQAVVTS